MKKRFVSLALAFMLAAGLAPVAMPQAVAVSEATFIVPLGKYDGIGWFNEGRALVIKDNKLGFIDADGIEVIPLIYDFDDDDIIINYSWFSDGLALVYKNGKFGYIDRNGKVVIPLELEANDISYFSDGLALVDGNYINKTGKIAFTLPDGYIGEGVFREGRATVRTNDYKYGLIDTAGNLIFTLDDGYRFGRWYNEYAAPIEVGGRAGAVDKTGKVIIQPEYDYVFHLGEQMIWVYKNNVGTYFDIATGQFISDLKYTNYKPASFHEGLAAVELTGKWGFIDKSGHEVIEPQYDGAGYGFIGGLTAVRKDDKYSLINIHNDVVLDIEGEYSFCAYGGDGLIFVEKKQPDGSWKLGIIDMDGNILLPVEYEYIDWFDFGDWSGVPGLICVLRDGKVGLIKLETTPDPHDGVAYSVTDLIVPGTGEPGFTIDLTTETFTKPEEYTIAAYSIDGGQKWKAAKSDTFSDAKFPKLLNKDMTLHLSNKLIEKATKKPPADATIVAFPKINKRADTPKLSVNYAIAADKTGKTPGEWVLTEKNGTSAVKTDIQVAVANSAKKAPDERGYGKFYDGASNGIAVMALTGAKPEKTVYFIRTAPKPNTDGSYTAASKPKKISVSGQQKAPNFKVDAKKKLIKVKAGTITQMDGGAVKAFTDKGELTAAGSYDLWMAATAKKPAGAKQTLRLG